MKRFLCHYAITRAMSHGVVFDNAVDVLSSVVSAGVCII